MKSWIDISAAALRANYAAIGRAAGPEYDLLCVLKANAYGHGASLCAPVLAEAGAEWLGVADLEEGVGVREALAGAGPAAQATRILVMCGFEPADAPGLLAHNLTPVVWTPAHLDALEQAAAAASQRVAVHVEIDSGMSRQGVRPGPDLARLAHRLAVSPWVRCEGLFSHLCCSEAAGSEQTRRQLPRFGEAIAQVRQAGLAPEFFHLGNSSSVDEASTLPWLPDQRVRRTLIRPGLALYGYTLPLAGDATPHLSQHLQPVATWKSRILALRDLQPGDTVGYGATFTAQHPMRVALLPVGYADGLRREASSGLGNGWVMLAGQRAPVLGRVSMNLTAVDVAGHNPQPVPGDEVTLLGPGVTAHDHARWANTIPYEILCGLRAHHRLVA